MVARLQRSRSPQKALRDHPDIFRREQSTMAKTLTFGIMHLGIAFSVTYALTGSLAISGAITFIEPAVNTVAHYFFDKYWERRERRGNPARGEVSPEAPAAPHLAAA